MRYCIISSCGTISHSEQIAYLNSNRHLDDKTTLKEICIRKERLSRRRDKKSIYRLISPLKPPQHSQPKKSLKSVRRQYATVRRSENTTVDMQLKSAKWLHIVDRPKNAAKTNTTRISLKNQSYSTFNSLKAGNIVCITTCSDSDFYLWITLT